MNSQQINIKFCVQKKRDELYKKKYELIKKRSVLLKQVIQVNTVLCKLNNFSKNDILQILENDLDKSRHLLDDIENNTQKIKLNTQDLIEDSWNELKFGTEKMNQRSCYLLDLENKYALNTLKNRINETQHDIILFKNKYEYENEKYSKLLEEFHMDILYNFADIYGTMLRELQNNDSNIERKYYILSEQNNRLLQKKRKSI